MNLDRRTAQVRLALAVAAAVAGLAGVSRGGQVVVDNTLGLGQTLAGPGYSIPASLGKQVGPNLFHSFSTLNLDSGDVATFTASAATKNILARVTGGAPSSINGTIATRLDSNAATPHSATFYLINPAGVVFGPDVSLDTGGSFVVSTANTLKLADGGVFHASDPALSVLTSAPPVAFGFLGPRPAGVSIAGQVNGGVAGTSSILRVGSGKSLTVVAGAVQMNNGALVAPSGSVHIAAVGAAGDVAVQSTGGLDVSGISTFADVTLNGAAISTSGAFTGGSDDGIEVHGAALSLNGGSTFISFNSGAGSGGGVSLQLSGELSLAGGSLIGVGSSGAGNPGPVRVAAASVTIGAGAADTSSFRSQNGATATADAAPVTFQTGAMKLLGANGISTSTLGASAAADIRISATSIEVLALGGIDSLTGSDGVTGRGGDLTLSADRFTLSGGSHVSSITTGSGPGGSLEMRGGTLSIAGGASAFTGTSGAGNAGNTVINVDTIFVDGNFSSIQASSTGNSGKGGNLTIGCKQLSVTHGATISILSNNDRGGGDLSITADSVLVSGAGSSLRDAPLFGSGGGGSIQIHAGTLDLEDGASILTEAFGFTAGGPIVVTAGNVLVRGGSEINASSGILGSGAGDAGKISVNAQTLLLDGAGSSITSDTDGAGTGGAITLSVPTINLRNGSAISAATNGTGHGGSIDITATNLDLRGGSTLFAFTDGPGDAGNISVSAKTLVASDPRSGIRAPTIVFDGAGQSGNGGDVRLTSGLVRFVNGASIVASAAATTADGTVDETNVVDRTGHAGQITVTANRVDFRGNTEGFASGISARTTVATPGTGSGGGIGVAAKELVLGNGAQLDTSSSGAGDAGAILLLTGSTRITGRGTHVQSNATGSGNAGGILVGAKNDFTLAGGARLAVSADQSTGGDIAISAGRRLTLLRGFLSASSSGTGGNIALRAGQLIELRNSTLTARAGQNGGRIRLDPPAVVLDHSVIDGRAGGTPVRVSIQSAGFLSADSRILTNAGILFPETDIAGSLVELPSPLITGMTQLVPQCGMRYSQDAISSFVTTGRGGTPLEPGGWEPAIGLDLGIRR